LTQLLVEYGARCDILDDSGNSAETILQSLVTRYGNGPNMELFGSYQQLLQLLWESNGKKLKLYRIIIITFPRLSSVVNSFFSRYPFFLTFTFFSSLGMITRLFGVAKSKTIWLFWCKVLNSVICIEAKADVSSVSPSSERMTRTILQHASTNHNKSFSRA